MKMRGQEFSGDSGAPQNRPIRLFYLEDCPYCHNARRALAELAAEDPKYRAAKIEWIEESRHPEIAGQYDYYYVPTVFAGDKKLYEARPSESYAECKEKLRAALDAAAPVIF